MSLFSQKSSLVSSLLISLAAAPGAELDLTIDLESSLSWVAESGRSYQLQGAASFGSPWTDLGSERLGDGSTQTYTTSSGQEWKVFQVIETIPGSPAQPGSPVNAGFEDGDSTSAHHWSTGGNQPPQRASAEAHTGSFSMHSSLGRANEGLMSQRVVAEGGSLTSGQSHHFSFWVKQISSGPSYVQQYEVQWLDASNSTVGSSGLKSFSATTGSWVQITNSELTAPANAVEARIRFRFVTGAVTNGHGEVFIDDITLGEAAAEVPDTINILPVTSEPVTQLSWASLINVPYQPVASNNLNSWRNIESEVIGDGGPKSIVISRTEVAEFYRLRYPEVSNPIDGTGIVPLFNASTPLEPATTIDTPTALITHVGDRARDRHAREGNFMAYDHYLAWYWEERSMNIEIIDKVAKGGTEVTFNYTTQAPLGAAEFRAFFRGIGTVAEYHQNQIADLIGPNQYSATLNQQQPELRPLQIGDRIEIEISQFLANPTNGRSNYYGTTMLYIVGQGIVPWEGLTISGGPNLDSYPLPENAWLGGLTTLPYQYSNEPDNRFKQMAGNLAPLNTQPFLLGRRLHHTSFDTGSHSEPGNPIFTEHVGKLGNKFINRSCVACHTNNGRALPPPIGAAMLQSVVKVGSDSNGAAHPILGSVLQPQSSTGNPEGNASISSYTLINGQYGDGTQLLSSQTQLQLHWHHAQPLSPFASHRSWLDSDFWKRLTKARSSPSPIPPMKIRMASADALRPSLDSTTGETRLGRFAYRASQPRLLDQIAAALNTDMGVTNPLAPVLDGEINSGPAEVSECRP